MGCEWWAHTRVSSRNLGHQLHFDTEEKTVERSGRIVHPLFSSVTYLCGERQGGPTLVLDQRVDDAKSGNVSVLVFPRDDSFMMFPGDRLHGVLPTTTTNNDRNRTKKRTKRAEETKQRTTLMVGFWAHDVTKSHRTSKREKFGPCCTFPRCTLCVRILSQENCTRLITKIFKHNRYTQCHVASSISTRSQNTHILSTRTTKNQSSARSSDFRKGMGPCES